jgi:glycine/D-amino acid oxidase-like deaminating enzyme
MNTDQDEYDVIVVGAGAGGMTAACVAAREGARTLLLEKANQVGGTTAISGGMVWAPGNPKFAPDQREADRDAARTYLGHTLPEWQDRTLTETYLARAGEAIEYLEARTSVRFRPVAFYPDYYPDLPGAAMGGRVLEPQAFDARELGRSFALLRPPLPEFTLFGGMMVDRADIPHLRKATQSLPSAWRVARILARYARDRMSFERGAHLVLGNALAARLLKSVLEAGGELLTSVTDIDLLREGDRVVGVTIAGAKHIRARRAVVLATGGFSHDPELRARYLPQKTGPSSAASTSNTGDGLRLGLALGARMPEDHVNNAFWVPSSRFVREDGTPAVYPHTVTDRGKPGVIAASGSSTKHSRTTSSCRPCFAPMRFRRGSCATAMRCGAMGWVRYGPSRASSRRISMADISRAPRARHFSRRRSESMQPDLKRRYIASMQTPAKGSIASSARAVTPITSTSAMLRICRIRVLRRSSRHRSTPWPCTRAISVPLRASSPTSMRRCSTAVVG